MVRIYSVATGQLLHSWSTAQRVLFSTYAFTPYSQSNTLLSWVDGDSAVTFMTTPYTLEPNSNNEYTAGATTVRVLDVAASGHDLLADSRVVWTVPTWHSGGPGAVVSCGQETTAPSLVANGKTVVCIGLSGTPIGSGKKAPILWRLSWLSYETSAPTVGHVHYQVTSRNPLTESGPNGNVLWTDPSGSTLLIAWAPYGPVNPVTHFGVVSHGKFTPLPTPPGNLLDVGPAIAW